MYKRIVYVDQPKDLAIGTTIDCGVCDRLGVTALIQLALDVYSESGQAVFAIINRTLKRCINF